MTNPLNCRKYGNQGFTLIELLIVIGILAVISAAVVLVINPVEYLARARDSRRLTELKSLNSALSLAEVNGLSLGSSSVVYVSLPDTSPACNNLGLPSLPSGWSYACSDSANYRKVNSAGWIPVNFTQISSGSPLSVLPVDPVNQVQDGLYYTYVPGASWKLTSYLESERYSQTMAKDGGPDTGLYEIGSNLNLANFQRGLVGYWKFEEGSGTTAGDSSGNGNTGTLTNGPAWTTGKVGSALSFDGVDDYVNSGNNLEWSGALTVISWHKRDSMDTINADGIVGNWYWTGDVNLRRGWVQRYYINTNSFAFIISLTNGSAVEEKQISYTTNVGNWYHGAAVFDPTDRTVKWYVDGKLRGSAVGSVGFNQIAFDSPNQMRIGNNPVNNGYFPGLVDDIRIYNRALSAGEIKAIYDATK